RDAGLPLADAIARQARAAAAALAEDRIAVEVAVFDRAGQPVGRAPVSPLLEGGIPYLVPIFGFQTKASMVDDAPERRILVLGGTTEAAQLAKAMQRRPRLHVITSLAGRTREPAAVPGGARSGGFGGIEGLIRYIREEHIDVIIDATHPYAEQI